MPQPTQLGRGELGQAHPRHVGESQNEAQPVQGRGGRLAHFVLKLALHQVPLFLRQGRSCGIVGASGRAGTSSQELESR